MTKYSQNTSRYTHTRTNKHTHRHPAAFLPLCEMSTYWCRSVLLYSLLLCLLMFCFIHTGTGRSKNLLNELACISLQVALLGQCIMTWVSCLAFFSAPRKVWVSISVKRGGIVFTIWWYIWRWQRNWVG